MTHVRGSVLVVDDAHGALVTPAIVAPLRHRHRARGGTDRGTPTGAVRGDRAGGGAIWLEDATVGTRVRFRLPAANELSISA